MRAARRLVTTWIAVLAVLMAALAPAVSHALGASGDAQWTEVCTSVGAKWVPVDGASDDAPTLPGALHLTDHCPYCALHADGFPVPPSLPALPPPALQGERVPAAFLHADRTLPVWSSAQPRAPPVPI